MGGKGARPEAMLRSLSGLQAGNDVRENSRQPEIIINREQGEYMRGRTALCLSVKFVTSLYQIVAVKPVKNERKNQPCLKGMDPSHSRRRMMNNHATPPVLFT